MLQFYIQTGLRMHMPVCWPIDRSNREKRPLHNGRKHDALGRWDL